jgi:hypothetical protein
VLQHGQPKDGLGTSNRTIKARRLYKQSSSLGVNIATSGLLAQGHLDCDFEALCSCRPLLAIARSLLFARLHIGNLLINRLSSRSPGMAMSPGDIESMFQGPTATVRAQTVPHLDGDEQDDDAAIDDEEKARRTLRLKQALISVQQARSSDSELLDALAEKLGDGSRDRALGHFLCQAPPEAPVPCSHPTPASWRASFGDSGLLDFFLTLLPFAGLRQALKIHTLRIIGNACADTGMCFCWCLLGGNETDHSLRWLDENRARVVQSNALSSGIIPHLADDSLLAFVIPVLYNICVDYGKDQLVLG